jgi:branched-chain amino acid transport system substrate-binding protein
MKGEGINGIGATRMKSKIARNWLAAAAFGLGCFPLDASADGDGPIKIGVPTAQTGPYGSVFHSVKRSVDFAVGEWNAKGGINGRQIDVKYADTESKPDVARKQAEKLALEGYNLLTGTISSGESLAIAPMLTRWDAVYVSTFSKSAKLTGDSCQERLFRANQGDRSDAMALTAWIQSRNEKKWVILLTDNAWGHDIAKAFTDAAVGSGKEIAATLFVPLGANDYAPYVQQAKSATHDGIYAAFAGRDAINFLTQAKQFGLLDNTVVAGNSITFDDNIKAVGATLDGAWGNIVYSATIDTPENKAFVDAWRKMYGEDPIDQEGQNYQGISVLLEAVKRAGSSDPAAVAKALSGGVFDTPMGKVTIRASDHQMEMPTFFGQVRDVDSKRQNVAAFVLPPEKATPPADPACHLAQN